MLAALHFLFAVYGRDLLVFALFCGLLAFGMWYAVKSDNDWRGYSAERRDQDEDDLPPDGGLAA